MTDDGKEFDLQPHPRILPMLGEINLAQWKCIAELVDNAVDGFLSVIRQGGSLETPEVQIQVPMTDDAQARLSVVDNGPGMSADTLELAVKAGWSGNDPISGLGMFGMGFNIATARLGTVTTVWTTRAGDLEWVGLTIDFEKLRDQRHFRTARRSEPKTDPSQHGTKIIIEKLKPEQRQLFSKAGNRTKLAIELARTYSAMLNPNGVPLTFRLTMNGRPLEGKRHCVWSGPGNTTREVQTSKFGPVDAFQSIDVKLDPRPYCQSCWQWLPANETACPSCGRTEPVVKRQRAVKGWLGVQRYLSETAYGIDFVRHGRKIEMGSKELFSWWDGDREEKEYPIDDPRDRGRVVGEIHLDHCRVSYTKDRFDRNDPAWDDMVRIVRGEGPLRPDKAAELAVGPNDSSLFKLFQVFRRSSPKSKVAGAWRKLLVVPDNDVAEEMARKFDAAEPAYQTDEKWWELVDEADRRLLLATGGTPPDVAAAPGPGDKLEGFTPPTVQPPSPPGPGAPTPLPTPPAAPTPPKVTAIASLSRQYGSDATQQRWIVEAFQADDSHPELEGGPWRLRRRPQGNHEFLVNTSHPVFSSATLTPLDALLAEMAWSAMDFLKDRPEAHTFGSILADLRLKYATSMALDYRSLSNEAKQTVSAIAATLAGNIEPSDAPVLFKELSPDEQNAVLQKMATRGAGSPQSIISAGRFLEYAPSHVVASFFSRHPELFFDGKCWDDPYATLDYQVPEATEVARSRVLRHHESLLSDAVWLADQDPADLAQASRARLLRAVYALELLAPSGEEAAE
jgi:hypothetical protein